MFPEIEYLLGCHSGQPEILMAALARSTATLRIAGDDLDPPAVSQLLNAIPTLTRAKGQTVKPGSVAVARTGQWHLSAKETEPADIDEQVEGILAQLPADLDIWRSLTARYRVDLFCGCFMNERGEGLEVSAETLSALGNRGIKLGICLYPPTV
jgi:hypothetical protein